MKISIVIILLLFQGIWIFAQQVADKSFDPEILNPEYETGQGPLILLDEAHYNFHTLEGRYSAFGKVLAKDGYRIISNENDFDSEGLKQCRILVIANALHESDQQEWITPTPSAFSANEIKIVNQWVRNGGRLFLIADHMPFPGAAYDLAQSFGFEMNNGFAFTKSGKLPDIFSRKNQMLKDNVISNGRDANEKVEIVATFTGQGFKIPVEAISILTFDEKYFSLMPDTAWVFDDSTKKIPLENLSQGAYLEHGKGRVVVFGEAAVFTAQVSGPQKQKMGMNAKEAKENVQLLLNIIHWLDEDVK
jgi:hypothetical protein